MVNLEDIKEVLENSVIALASINKENKPHNIVVASAKIKSENIIITDNYMETTVQNIKDNKFVSLVFWEGEDGWRIDGEAEYFDSGRWLDYVKSLEENEGFPAKGAIVIKINKITELG